MRKKIKCQGEWLNLTKSMLLCGFIILFSLGLRYLGINTHNILLIFLMGALFAAILTKSYLWGILASVTLSFSFNYFFMLPQYTFQIQNHNDYVTFVFFILISLISIALVSALQKHSIVAEENRRKLEQEKLKGDLLRGLSHDLRTPLTGIIGGAEFLLENLESVGPEEIRMVLKDIDKEAVWLSEMVENFLNMTRIQDGKLALSAKGEVVEDVVIEALGRVEKRKGSHEIYFRRPEEILVAPMDHQLIVQVLVNLFDNVFWHTQKDSRIEIHIDAKPSFALIEVADNGGGIPEDQLPFIFDTFFTKPTFIGDKQRGLGLGLSICRAIMEVHKGEIWGENNQMGGISFFLKLPLEEMDKQLGRV